MDMRSQYKQGDTVTIRGRKFEVRRSSVLMEGESEPQLGVVFNVVTMACPMPVLDTGQVQLCRAWMDLALDFAPIAYVCQACRGIIIVDEKEEATWYADANGVEWVSGTLGLYFYPAGSARSSNLDAFQRWFAMRSPTAAVVGATVHNREMHTHLDQFVGRERRLVFPRFYSLGELLPGMQPERKPELTTVAQLDARINAGGSAVPRGDMSAEMAQLLEQYGSATLCMQRGELAEAVRAYRRIVSAWPSFVAASVNLANCLTSMGRQRQALEELDRVHVVAPGDPDIHFAAARVYDSMGDKEREIQEHQKALGDDPNSVSGMINLGATYREIGQLDLAKQWLLRAMAEVPGQRRSQEWKRNCRLRIQYGLALTYQDAEDWERAVECWQECLSLDPSNPQFQGWLQQAQSNAQRTSSRIRRWFKRA